MQSNSFFQNSEKLPLYAAAHGRVTSLGGDECLFRITANGQLHVMTNQVLQALSVAKPFRTLDGHMGEICKAFPALANQTAAVRKVLDFLVNRGLLVNADQWLADMHRGPQETSAAEFAGVFIRTCDRPQAIERLLDSALQNQQQWDASHPYIIVDDSRKTASREANQAVCDKARARGLDVRFVSVEERAQIIAQAIQNIKITSDQQEAVEWMLMGPKAGTFTGGSVLNFILLATAGKRFLLFDDDFTLDTVQHPECQDTASFGDQIPKLTRLFTNPEMAEANYEPLNADPIAFHLDALGKSVAEVLDGPAGRTTEGKNLQGLTMEDVYPATGSSTVRLTRNGYFGHTASDRREWLFTLKPDARNSFIGDEDRYQALLDDPYVFDTTSGWHFGKRFDYSASGIDNSALMPFTAPEHRGEDYFFSAMTAFLYPQDIQLSMPWGLRHQREDTHARHELDSPWRHYFSRLVATDALLLEQDCLAESASDRMAWFAAHWQSVADASSRDRNNRINEFNAVMRSGLLRQLQEALASAGENAPEYWKSDLERILQANGTSLTQGNTIELRDCPDGDADMVASTSAGLSRHLASALRVWPELWEYAREQDWLTS